MDRKLIRSGNSWALPMNSTILQLMNINPETDLINVSVHGDEVRLTRSQNKRNDFTKKNNNSTK